MAENQTLEVRLDSEEQHSELVEDICALEPGEEVEERHVLILDTEEELQLLLSPSNLALLRAIRHHGPESMRGVADLVDCDFKQVHRNLTELNALNVIDL